MKQVVISPAKANGLYWLGRYTERVYLELHLLRRCFDLMIDGKEEDYNAYLTAIGNTFPYADLREQRIGLVHDKANPVSVISCIERANDNAILLRDEIMSPTLGYIQMSLERLRHASAEMMEPDLEELQTLTDWMLAFWGSIEERVYDDTVKNFLRMGKIVEHIDMNIRFSYKFYRIEEAFAALCKIYEEEPRAFCSDAMESLRSILTGEEYDPKDPVYVNKTLLLLGKLVTL